MLLSKSCQQEFSKSVSCKQIVSAILFCKQILLQTSAAWLQRRHIQFYASHSSNRTGFSFILPSFTIYRVWYCRTSQDRRRTTVHATRYLVPYTVHIVCGVRCMYSLQSVICSRRFAKLTLGSYVELQRSQHFDTWLRVTRWESEYAERLEWKARTCT